MQETVMVTVEPDILVEGNLTVPDGAEGIVLFAHGSGSSRHSPRNRYVAEVLNNAKLATLLFDLLTPEEGQMDEQTRTLRFNIDLLSQRLVGAVDWLTRQAVTRPLNIGLFGASTGAGAALSAAAARSSLVSAVVSRGGRPDLAGEALARVQAPTLLIVGGHDDPVIQHNQKALSTIPTTSMIEIIPGASHLFEEPGALERVAELSRDWFQRYLIKP